MESLHNPAAPPQGECHDVVLQPSFNTFLVKQTSPKCTSLLGARHGVDGARVRCSRSERESTVVLLTVAPPLSLHAGSGSTERFAQILREAHAKAPAPAS